MPVQRKVTAEIEAALFKLYQDNKSIRELAQIFRISEPTIKKVKKRRKWDELIEKARNKAAERSADKFAYTLAGELTQINALTPLVVRSLLYQAKQPRQCPECKGTTKVDGHNCNFCDGRGAVRVLDTSVLDYERLVRLKKDVLEVVQPELPTDPVSKEPVVDRHAELLDKIEKATEVNVEELGDLIAEDILKQRKGGGDQPK